MRIVASLSLVLIAVNAVFAMFVPLSAAGCPSDGVCGWLVLVGWGAMGATTIAAFVAVVIALSVSGQRPRRAWALTASAGGALVLGWVVAGIVIGVGTSGA